MYEYDANGQTTKMTDALSNEWTYGYDALGRTISVTTPKVSGTAYSTTKEYDGSGNVTKVTDFKSNVTSYTYNALNQRTKVTYADASTVEYTWTCCRISKVVDALGTTNLSYDGLHRLTSITDANGKQVQYSYDNMSRILEVIDHTSAKTRYNHDMRGGMTKLTADYGTANAKETAYT